MNLRFVALSGVTAAAILSATVSSATAGGANPLTRTRTASSTKSELPTVSIPNIFARARGLALDESDYDRYIDPSVRGKDRAIARKIMHTMPVNQRGDFVYASRSGHLVSNNPSLLQTVVFKRDAMRSPSTGRSAFQAKAAQPDDYNSPCSPPDPPTSPGGAYVRQVSQCGYTTQFAFVNVACNTTHFQTGDEGNLYGEIYGPSLGSAPPDLFEGGLQYNNDNSVQPYAREDGSYLTLNNSTAKYACNQILVDVAGIIYDGSMVFTEMGQLPAGLSPYSVFIDFTSFTPNNAAWMFFEAGPNYYNPGYDPYGDASPCVSCSISRLSTIAQSGVNQYKIDGSYFGVNSNGTAAISWLQVAFGEWDLDCVPGTTQCTFDYASDPLIYYGGPQYYPNSTIAQSDLTLVGYGPYETYDGINLSTQNAGLGASGGFTEPLPPLPCSLDAMHYCATVTSSTTLATKECLIGDKEEQFPSKSQSMYAVYSHHSVAEVVKEVISYTDECPPQPQTFVWTPNEPSVKYSDPKLP